MILSVIAPFGMATEIGHIKVVQGEVWVERQGKAIAANVGMTLVTLDILRTGANGSVGVTMNDDSLLGAGPNAIVALDHFSFDRTTGQGRFDSRLSAGRLLVVSGRIAKSSPAAMTVRTPLATLAVRGTEFAVVVE